MQADALVRFTNPISLKSLALRQFTSRLLDAPITSDSEYMAGQLSAFGYTLSENPEVADLWLINTCTVKSPSQSAMDTLIARCKKAKKPLVVAGCVPQGSRDLKELEGVSIVGVQQIDRVVEVVEETLKGHEVRLLTRKTLPALDLPKVRKNKFVEILPINVGCLGACTYCKTKHARGHLGSYTVESLVRIIFIDLLRVAIKLVIKACLQK
uniref:MTTase N-terminal domain-containing protein n=1 Tax=Kalanchoe fedtschenkoi TaxID=63787 RepID=A0A7N0RI70_KALFE